jgi:hypothetical protein
LREIADQQTDVRGANRREQVWDRFQNSISIEVDQRDFGTERDHCGRHLHDEQIMDRTGRLRVVFPTPNWDDYLQLDGAENFQIARRLRTMIDNLVATLPEGRRPALRQELELLDRTIEKLYCRKI